MRLFRDNGVIRISERKFRIIIMQKQIEMFQTDLIIQIHIGRLTMSYLKSEIKHTFSRIEELKKF